MDFETTISETQCSWFTLGFTIEYRADGIVDRYKVCLVAKRYDQQPSLDYEETFNPVIQSTTIRLVLGIVVTQNWPLRQLEVNNAFLQRRLSEDVCMS